MGLWTGGVGGWSVRIAFHSLSCTLRLLVALRLCSREGRLAEHWPDRMLPCLPS